MSETTGERYALAKTRARQAGDDMLWRARQQVLRRARDLERVKARAKALAEGARLKAEQHAEEASPSPYPLPVGEGIAGAWSGSPGRRALPEEGLAIKAVRAAGEGKARLKAEGERLAGTSSPTNSGGA